MSKNNGVGNFLLLFSCLALSGLGVFVFKAKAANTKPPGYVSLHQDYGRATADKDGRFRMPAPNIEGYMPYFRVFVPPGARSVYLAIYEYGGQTAVVRYKVPPTTTVIPANYFDAHSRKLSELEVADQIISENKEGKLTIINETISVSQNDAGWLYSHVFGGETSSVYSTKFLIEVDATTYNDWYDTAGSNPNGSINWERDVEGATTYNLPAPTPLPSPVFLLGDLNQDRKVDIFDYNLFLDEFGKTAVGNLADLNQSGKVDIFDYNIFLGNFGKRG